MHWSSDLFCIWLSTAFKHVLEILHRIIIFSLSLNCNASVWTAEADRCSVIFFNRGKIGSASVMILSHQVHQNSAGTQTTHTGWMTSLHKAGLSEHVHAPQPVHQRSVKRGKVFQTALELCISLLTLTDWRKQILLALGRADFTWTFLCIYPNRTKRWKDNVEGHWSSPGTAPFWKVLAHFQRLFMPF